MKFKKEISARKKRTLEDIEIDIEVLTSVVDDINYMRSLPSGEVHELCNAVMAYEWEYKQRTGHFYYPT